MTGCCPGSYFAVAAVFGWRTALEEIDFAYPRQSPAGAALLAGWRHVQPGVATRHRQSWRHQGGSRRWGAWHATVRPDRSRLGPQTVTVGNTAVRAAAGRARRTLLHCLARPVSVQPASDVITSHGSRLTRECTSHAVGQRRLPPIGWLARPFACRRACLGWARLTHRLILVGGGRLHEEVGARHHDTFTAKRTDP